MSRYPNEEPQTPQARRLQEWWLGLPLAYRVNALLYGLGAVALAFLLVTLLSDDGRDVQVGAGTQATAVTTVPVNTVTTRAGAATSSSPSSSSPTSSSSPSTTASGASPTTATTRASTPTSASQATTTRPVDSTSATTTTTTPVSTTAPTNCRNSSHPACGAFVWDPAPAANAPLDTNVALLDPSKTSYKVNEQVFFKVTVSDPDHVVNENCSEVRFDNGAGADGPCNPPPECPARHGPWTPPAATPGNHTGNYINAWATPGQHTITVRFRSWSPTTCLALDPYASEGQTVTATVTITE